MQKFQRTVILVVGLSLMAVTAWAGHETYQGFRVVHVIVNGQPVQSDVPAINFHGRTMLPVRAIAEALGAEVEWDASTYTATLTAKAVTAASPLPIEFKGTGQSASPIFQLNKGVYVVQMSHKGARNFSIVVQSTAGEYIDLLVNRIGAFNGSKVLVIETGGRFILDITADGDWSVSITPAN